MSSSMPPAQPRIQQRSKGILTWTALMTLIPLVITVVVLVIVGVALAVAYFFAR